MTRHRVLDGLVLAAGTSLVAAGLVVNFVLWPPAMVSTSRTTSQPSAGRSTRNAVLRAWGGSASGSVLAIRIAKFAPRAPLMNHLCPFTTQWSPSFTARVWMSVGSDPATSGSVMAKHERL